MAPGGEEEEGEEEEIGDTNTYRGWGERENKRRGI
jgi:hypothetical protein